MCSVTLKGDSVELKNRALQGGANPLAVQPISLACEGVFHAHIMTTSTGFGGFWSGGARFVFRVDKPIGKGVCGSGSFFR